MRGETVHDQIELYCAGEMDHTRKMDDYVAYQPSQTFCLEEPRMDGRYFFESNEIDWVQVIQPNQFLDLPMRFCVSIDGFLLGATTQWGLPAGESAFLEPDHGRERGRFLTIQKIPARVFQRSISHSPKILQTTGSETADVSTLRIALDGIKSAMVTHSSKYPPSNVIGIAIPEVLQRNLRLH